MKKLKTVAVPPTQLINFKKRADECFQLAEIAYSKRFWLGTCINSIHAGIALADCLCISVKGLRYAGANHDEAVELYSSIKWNHEDFDKSVRNFGKLLSVKHHAEYTGKPITEKDAELVMKSLQRLKDFIFSCLPK